MCTKWVTGTFCMDAEHEWVLFWPTFVQQKWNGLILLEITRQAWYSLYEDSMKPLWVSPCHCWCSVFATSPNCWRHWWTERKYSRCFHYNFLLSLLTCSSPITAVFGRVVSVLVQLEVVAIEDERDHSWLIHTVQEYKSPITWPRRRVYYW